MSQLDVFRLDGRVALVPGGGGAIGSAMAGALAGAGARVTVVDVTDERAEAAAARLREAGAEVLALGADVTSEAECERIVAATVERLRAPRHHRQLRRGRSRQGPVRRRGLPPRRVGLDLRAQRAEHAPGDPGCREGDDRRWSRWSRPQHLVGPRLARHQRRLLGLRRREGRHQLAHPAVGDRVGQARHHGQRDRPDLRRHAAGGDAARRPGVQGRHRRPDPARAASAARPTSRARPSSSVPTHRRSSPARSSESTAGSPPPSRQERMP